jgi:hypothetical protein
MNVCNIVKYMAIGCLKTKKRHRAEYVIEYKNASRERPSDNNLVAVTRTFGGPLRSGIGPPPPWSFRSPPHYGQPGRCGINTLTVLE